MPFPVKEDTVYSERLPGMRPLTGKGCERRGVLPSATSGEREKRESALLRLILVASSVFVCATGTMPGMKSANLAEGGVGLGAGLPRATTFDVVADMVDVASDILIANSLLVFATGTMPWMKSVSLLGCGVDMYVDDSGAAGGRRTIWRCCYLDAFFCWAFRFKVTMLVLPASQSKRRVSSSMISACLIFDSGISMCTANKKAGNMMERTFDVGLRTMAKVLKE